MRTRGSCWRLCQNCLARRWADRSGAPARMPALPGGTKYFARWLLALLKSIDIFTFWTLILLAIGFATTNPKKLKGSKAFTIAFNLWAVYVVCRVGGAWIFS
jgi:hypothetical protein